jgi:hypothetical protein
VSESSRRLVREADGERFTGSFYLFLTWLPNYLVETMHMSILKSAGFTAIPWACATVADLVVGGWLIDHLIARGHAERSSAAANSMPRFRSVGRGPPRGNRESRGVRE